jgi:hypothetical protein
MIFVGLIMRIVKEWQIHLGYIVMFEYLFVGGTGELNRYI